MAHRRAAAEQWRRINGDHRMDAEQGGQGSKKATVLLTTDALSNAVRETTQGGKKRLEGLYLPNGQRVETMTAQQRVEAAKVVDAELQETQALSKVAKAYNRREHHKSRQATRTKRTAETLEDEESAKKALAILDASSEHEKIMYRDLFDFFDVDKDRTWGSIEFAQRMTDIGFGTSVENASNLLYFAGVRDVDRITFNDFVQLMPKLKAFRIVLEKDAMRSFQAKDIYRKGWISCDALKSVLIAMSGPDGYSEEYVKRTVRIADRERTGRITFDFFIRALFGSPPLIDYKPPSAASSLKNRFCFCRGGLPDDEEEEQDKRL